MNPFTLMSDYFWLIAITVTVINWAMFRKRAQKYITDNPTLREGYQALFRGYLIWMNVPWVVMGLGSMVGGAPSVWHYFRPQDGNPYVLTWFATLFLLWILGTYWLFFRGGAETLAQHPGAIEFHYGFKRKDVTSPKLIKVFWLLGLAGGIVGVVLMWTSNVPTPILQ
jgi:hypothetical protein